MGSGNVVFNDPRECWPARQDLLALTHDLSNDMQTLPPHELEEKVASISERVLDTSVAYTQDSRELSNFARAHLFHELSQVLNHIELRLNNSVNQEQLARIKSSVLQQFGESSATYRSDWQKIFSESYVRKSFRDKFIFLLTEAAALVDYDVTPWKNSELNGGGVFSTAIKVFFKDLKEYQAQVFQQGILSDAERGVLDNYVNAVSKTVNWAQKLFRLEVFFNRHQDLLVAPDLENDPRALNFDLRTLYAMQPGIKLASPELVSYVERLIKDFVFEIQADIVGLRPGEQTIIPGGFTGIEKWIDSTEDGAGHSNLYQIMRVDSGEQEIPRFSFTIIDSGYIADTKSRHSNSYLGGNIPDYFSQSDDAFYFTLNDLSLSQVADEKTLTQLLRSQIISGHEPRGLRNIFLTILNGFGREEFEIGERFELPESSDNCFYLPFLSLSKMSLRNLYEGYEVALKNRVLNQLRELEKRINDKDPDILKETESLQINEHGTSLDGRYVVDFFIERLVENLQGRSPQSG